MHVSTRIAQMLLKLVMLLGDVSCKQRSPFSQVNGKPPPHTHSAIKQASSSSVVLTIVPLCTQLRQLPEHHTRGLHEEECMSCKIREHHNLLRCQHNVSKRTWDDRLQVPEDVSFHFWTRIFFLPWQLCI